jgi:glycosyltransferase involved in cell wall biosynthesis
MTISLIINTYDRPDALAKVFSGLAHQSRCPDEIIVADDGSKEDTKQLIDTWRKTSKAPVQHVWQTHLDFRRTVILNKAIRIATSDYIVFLDGDCVPHRNFVADHQTLAEDGFWVQGRRCFVKEEFVPEFETDKSSVWRWLMAGRITGGFKALRLPVPIVRRSAEQRGIIGCNMGFWKKDLVAVNGFDESFVGWGGEDSDLGSRLYHLGRLRKLVYGRAIVYHLNHPPLPRDKFRDNTARLQETLRSRRIRCEQGLAQHA